MTRAIRLDPFDEAGVPWTDVPRLVRTLQLADEKPPELDRYGFYDGQWVHTPKPVVLDWSGPATWRCWRTGELVHGTSNAHRIEGVLTLGGPWPMVTTTLTHPAPKYQWSPRRFANTPVIYTVRRREDIVPGPLNHLGPRAVNLEERP